MTEQVLVVQARQRCRVDGHRGTGPQQPGPRAGGYANMLRLGGPAAGRSLGLSVGRCRAGPDRTGRRGRQFFELDARDILLFKRHPEATSARNLLACRVSGLFGVNNRVGVELNCGGSRLIAQIVPESMRELGIEEGDEVVAVIKASSFRRLL